MFFLIILCISFYTIAFSAISSTMNITGIGYARIATDVRITSTEVKSAEDSLISYTEFSRNTVATNFTLNNDSSSVTYSIDITNYNSNRVGIYSLSGLPDGLNYSISTNYEIGNKLFDGVGTTSFDLVISGVAGEYEFILNFDFRSIYNISYKGLNGNYQSYIFENDVAFIDLNDNDVNDLSITVGNGLFNDYSFVDNILTLRNVTGDVVVTGKYRFELVSGDLITPGGEVCLGKECFYIVNNDGEKVTLLSKYNLYVGSVYNNGTLTEYGNEATGIQDSTMTAWIPTSSIWRGIIKYSDSNYWSSNGSLKQEYGSSYPAYVYDNNSNLFEYVESYKNYLVDIGGNVSKSRLLSYEEAVSLGCSLENVCSKSWVYSTTYWLGSAYDNSLMWRISTDKLLNNDDDYYDYARGVRPVIEINASDILVYTKPVIVRGDLNTPGSEVCLMSQCFYVVSNDGVDVTLFSKYNLHVGNSYNTSTKVLTPHENPSGIQDSNFFGWRTYELISNGVTVFSTDEKKGATYSDYQGSLIKEYVDNYSNYLKSLSYNIIEARLITEEELVYFGCVGSSRRCSSANSWIYNTSFWSMSSTKENYLWRVGSDGSYGDYAGLYSNGLDCGVRPVIKMAISDF